MRYNTPALHLSCSTYYLQASTELSLLLPVSQEEADAGRDKLKANNEVEQKETQICKREINLSGAEGNREAGKSNKAEREDVCEAYRSPRMQMQSAETLLSLF